MYPAYHRALNIHSRPVKKNAYTGLRVLTFSVKHTCRVCVHGSLLILLTVMHVIEECRRVLLPMAAFGTCKLVNGYSKHQPAERNSCFT
jgi:hypothetical protein